MKHEHKSFHRTLTNNFPNAITALSDPILNAVLSPLWQFYLELWVIQVDLAPLCDSGYCPNGQQQHMNNTTLVWPQHVHPVTQISTSLGQGNTDRFHLTFLQTSTALTAHLVVPISHFESHKILHTIRILYLSMNWHLCFWLLKYFINETWPLLHLLFVSNWTKKLRTTWLFKTCLQNEYTACIYRAQPVLL